MTALDDYVLTDAVEMSADASELAARFNMPTESSAPIADEKQEAPWGYKADGTPKAKPGRRSTGTTNRVGRTSSPRTRNRNQKDYRPAVMGLVQMVAFPLTMAGAQKPELALDGAALVIHSPAIADALHEIAVNNPQVAAVLEQLMQIGPYGALIGAMVPLGIQIAANHKMLPTGAAEQMGALSPDKLMGVMAQMAVDPRV